MKSLALALMMLIALPSLAEDTAFVKLLGFSANGSHMAFQEALVQDGSGNFYSRIRVLDNVNDRYVFSQGAELETVDDQQSMTFSAFVAQAQSEVASNLRRFGINASNGETVHVSTAPNLSTMVYQGKYLTLYKRDELVASSDAERLELCNSYGDGAVFEGDKLLGYSIVATNADDHVFNPNEVHRDTRVPGSRSCPTGYAINSAFAFGDQVVLMIAVKSFGFEGPDIRFITVPFDISAL